MTGNKFRYICVLSGSFAGRALRIPPASYFAVVSATTIYAVGTMPVVSVNDCVIVLPRLIILSLWSNALTLYKHCYLRCSYSLGGYKSYGIVHLMSPEGRKM